MAVNALTGPNLLRVGQVLRIPPLEPVGQAPGFKTLPVSELMAGPLDAGFTTSAWLAQ
ncbi:MAG TPA: hypothetical protein G4O04_04540 [Anaerolineae bacterium]|nr:hypothetical protein [Anaerolineae bacterium]